ncbi:UNVERIFIED_CONTAM: Sister chromatid cohesion protein pds5 [Sesamum angustifolium]|uniref:Sister chromatid cohesion protein pds5 n=1 Tax=Sesamum angustifolium TaxID=2727405 RepID=A0AAW2L611_9LAMI
MAEAEKKEEEAKKAIAQIGTQLAASKICPNKSNLVKLLKQAASAFEELKQSESLKSSVKPLSDSLIKHGLLDHKDKDIRLLVGVCLCEVIRVLAPNPDFSHAVSRDIFKFLLSMFVELDDTASPYFSRRAKLLETVAKLQFVWEDHPRSLINSMSSIITSVLEAADLDSSEKSTSQSLIDVILQNIIKERKGVASASIRLAGTVIQNCGEKLERCICQFLTSCILNRDAVGSVIKESYHEIILEIFQIAPQMLLSVIPCLTHELLTDQVDVRIKALNLIRKLLLHGQHFAREYPHVFIELLNRFSDKSAEVRVTALSCAKALYMTNPSGRVSLETLSAIQGRLLDHDDKVRTEAVNVVCELAKSNLNFTSSDLISQAAERLRDKKVSVRREALKKLVELYQEYCMRCAAGITLLNEHIEEIPCKILMLCYEKNCPEFRPQSMELVLADLFPSSLSIEERTRHWIFMFPLFKPPHLKALKTILSQKRRLRDGLITYLDIWNRAETIIGAFPSLLKGSEKQFQLLLLEREIPFNEQLIEILAREGCHMSIKLSDIYSALEKVCLQGTRVQSKLAVSAIAALADTSEQFIFSGLCKALASKDVDFSDETSNCCKSCKLKVFGLKALVRSFLPHKHTSLTRPINFILDIIQMLQRSGSSPGSNPCEHDEAFIRLAAANSVLRLSRKWDLHISSEIFRSTILMAKDHSPVVRRSFASKMHKLLSNHALPSRYACAFSFVVVDALEDLRCDALAYLEKFIREYGKGAQIHETKTMQGATNHPVYIVVFLIHVLAHATDFPSSECQDEKLYARFLSPLFVTVQALVNEKLFDGNLHLVSNAASFLRSIFNAIKKAEDAVDARMTPVNAYAFIGSKADASFTKKLVSCLKIEVFGISSMGTKNSRQFYETSSRPSGNRHNKSNSGYGYSDNVLMNETKEQVAELHTGQNEPCGTSSCEIDTRGRQNKAMLVQLGSVELHNEFSAGNKHERDANRNMGAKSSLPCDSATTKPSLAQNEGTVSCSREDDAVTKCGSISAEPSILSRVGDQMSYSTSKVTYETGEVNILNLDSKKWEIDLDDLQVQYCDQSHDSSSANDQRKAVDTHRYDSKQENMPKNGDICGRKVSKAEKQRNSSIIIHLHFLETCSVKLELKAHELTPSVVKRAKRCKDASGKSTSEVIDTSINDDLPMPRRTRRQKV